MTRNVEESRSLIDQAVSEIRTISHLLHPPLLDEVGLISALNEYVKGFGERSKNGFARSVVVLPITSLWRIHKPNWISTIARFRRNA